MYGRSILTILGAVSLVFMTTGFNFAFRIPFSPGGDTSSSMVVSNVLMSVENNLNVLNKEVHSRVPASVKVEKLKRTLEAIEEIRKQNPIQTVDREVYMDFATNSLQHVAEDPEFRKEKCPEYKARVMVNFEPYSEVVPSHPALKRSYQIIEGLCS